MRKGSKRFYVIMHPDGNAGMWSLTSLQEAQQVKKDMESYNPKVKEYKILRYYVYYANLPTTSRATGTT